MTRAARVWLVDPDPAMQGSVSWLLRHLPVELLVYRYGRDFLTGAEVSPPGCVLVDADLPDVSGLEVLRAVRAQAAGRVPVIVLASAPDVNLAVQALRDGAADFFEKPFLGAALTRRVEAALAEAEAGATSREPENG
ncbi:MAG TPA: response regulator [Thermoanaerobaculia bacterium]|nr:response regulator [Thermoanaerobaculia bacterium]